MKFFQLLGNKKTILILFLIFVGFNIYFSTVLKDLNEIANQEVKILDLRFGYSLEEVNLFFRQIGSEGRILYEKISMADMFYPIFYGLLLMSLISRFTKGNSKLLLLNLIPLVMIILDFVENISIKKLMTHFPNIGADMVSFTSILTQAKWVFVGLSIFLVLILLGRNFYMKKK